MSQMIEFAERVLKEALSLGADEVSVSTSSGSQTSIQRREGQVEQASEATTRGLGLSLMQDGRWSSHSTSDLRPDAITLFIKQGLQATAFLEADPDRALASPEDCGAGCDVEALELLDPSWPTVTAESRADFAKRLEDATQKAALPNTLSTTVHVADGRFESARVMSNGFSQKTVGGWFSVGGETTLSEPGGKRPEAYAYYGTRHRADLPSTEHIAHTLFKRAKERMGAGPIASGDYPLILLNRVTSRLLGVIAAPLAGGSIHQKRSCLADMIGSRIGSESFTLIDDPFVKRGLNSRGWDGDGLRAQKRTIIQNGVLKQHYINTYYARKLGVNATTGGRSNWIIPPGSSSWREVAKQLDRAILVTGFLGGNANSTTGDFSYGINGLLLENGEPTRSLSEMNLSGNTLTLFKQLAQVCDDPWEYSSVRCPTLVFNPLPFSGT